MREQQDPLQEALEEDSNPKMGITMMQFLTGLTGVVGCMVCLSITRMVIGITASLSAAGVMGQGRDRQCVQGGDSIVTMFLLIMLCVHLATNCIFGRVTVGNLNYSLTADITDWIFNVSEFAMAIHLLGAFKTLAQCIDSNADVDDSDFVYHPVTCWSLLVCWITVDSILFIFRILITYIIYTKVKTKGYQRKYIIQ